jgi:hypothetical protein
MKLFNWFKKRVINHCVLLQEFETSRIVQRRHPDFKDKLVIGRERFINGRWQLTSFLYTNQCETLERYIGFFNVDEKMTNEEKQFGQKQFTCLQAIKK